MKVKRGVRRAPVSFTELTLPSLITVAILALAGCSAGAGSGGNGNNITVAITNKVTSVQAGTAAISFSATVQNDSSNKGVTWSLTANGSSCSPTCGALSAATTTSVTYTPPASAGASPNNQPTLTATSVAKTTKSDSDTFTVSPALTVTITNKVSTVNSGTEPFVVNATVQNDSTNSGVSWSLTANGSACSPACGTLSGSTTTSVTYAPPATTPSSPNNQPKITATSIAKSSTIRFRQLHALASGDFRIDPEQNHERSRQQRQHPFQRQRSERFSQCRNDLDAEGQWRQLPAHLRHTYHVRTEYRSSTLLRPRCLRRRTTDQRLPRRP